MPKPIFLHYNWLKSSIIFIGHISFFWPFNGMHWSIVPGQVKGLMCCKLAHMAFMPSFLVDHFMPLQNIINFKFCLTNITFKLLIIRMGFLVHVQFMFPIICGLTDVTFKGFLSSMCFLVALVGHIDIGDFSTVLTNILLNK